MADRAAGARARTRPAAGGQTTVVAVVLRRSDFRESSRIVTCLTREHGRITGLAKGAHRSDSPFLGRLDFLNEVRATFSADRGGLRLLVRADLLRERRALREPSRYLAATHLAWLAELASQEHGSAAAAFDLLHGGLNLIERCPEPTIPLVVLGLELRHLHLAGAMPDLESCTDCGASLHERAHRHPHGLGLACARHAADAGPGIPPAAIALLRQLHGMAGRLWPTIEPSRVLPAAAALPPIWLAAATEQRSPWRRSLFQPL